MSSLSTGLRIVHCVRTPVGGTFRNVLDLALAQSARGHTVGIVLDSTSGGSFEAKTLAAAAPHLALGVTDLAMSRAVLPGDLLSLWRVYRAVRGLAPDVMHGHGAKAGAFARLIGTLLSREGRQVARLYTPHGGSLHFAKSSLSGRLVFCIERLLERVCDGIIHVSRFEAEVYCDKVGPARCDASIVVNGLRPEEYDRVEPAAHARDLLYMGMMRDLKGADVLIRAIARIRDKTGRAPTAYMLGNGPDRDTYRRLVDELHLSQAIAFHDPLPTRQGLAMGRLMVVPSRAESMPYIVLESVAAGLPLIATRVGGIPEILGEDGLVPPSDVDALAAAIEAALADPAGTAARAVAARSQLRERFTIDAMTQAVEDLYRMVLARRRPDVPEATLPRLQAAQ
jgi:glycosyltransferase involved in cell wall biosynthesis